MAYSLNIIYLLWAAGKWSVHMVDNVDSVDSTAVVGVAAVVADAGIPAMLLGIVGIAGTAACIAGLRHWQCCMSWLHFLHCSEVCYNKYNMACENTDPISKLATGEIISRC